MLFVLKGFKMKQLLHLLSWHRQSREQKSGLYFEAVREVEYCFVIEVDVPFSNWEEVEVLMAHET